jgi:hypothetical protein
MPIIIANKTGEVDSAYSTLIKHIKSPLPIVMVSYSDNFVFNEELLSLNKGEFILFDFIEMGWNYDWGRHGLESFRKRFKGEEWWKFHEWVSGRPLFCFRRELDKASSSIPGYFPIEYPCLSEPYPIQTKEEFNARPVSVFQYWGRSNENRLRIHGEIWQHSYKKGFQVCDNVYYINDYLRNEQGEKWITLWIPHYHRIDLKNLMAVNNISKLSLSWAGAGFKCFRTMESPVNSVMVMTKNNFAWSHNWDETNCILVEPGKEIEGIEEALKNPNLYDIYLKGVENVDKYRLKNYIPFLENIINENLHTDTIY